MTLFCLIKVSGLNKYFNKYTSLDISDGLELLPIVMVKLFSFPLLKFSYRHHLEKNS